MILLACVALATVPAAEAYIMPGQSRPGRMPPPLVKAEAATTTNNAAAASAALAAAMMFGMLGAPVAAFSDDGGASALAAAPVAGFEQFAAEGGTMKTDPQCFFDQCGPQTKSCFTNPSCLKGITCLGNCRGEQLCATQCFARFGSERLNDWLSCTLEDKQCVVTGVAQDTSSFYNDPPLALPDFKPSDLEGKWFKVLGYNPKYDTYPCQINTFTPRATEGSSGGGGLYNDILFRVPKPGAGGGSWQNNFVEEMDRSKGPQGKASMTVEGKMFGLTFHEQWYVVGQGEGWRAVAYKGDTQQGPYEGAFVYTAAADTLAQRPDLQKGIDASLTKAGLDPAQMLAIDNSCPTDATAAGVSAAESSKDKLEWKDVFELAEWFRPGTLAKPTDFDPNKM